jgi:putative transposase
VQLTVTDSVKSAITAVVTQEPGILLRDLILAVDSHATADDVYLMILYQDIWVDLERDPLAEPHRTRVYINRQTADAYAHASDRQEVGRQSISITFDTGAEIFWGQQLYTVAASDENGLWLIRPPENPVKLTWENVDALLRSGAIRSGPKTIDEQRIEAFAIFASADPQDLKEANKRMQEIQPFLNSYLYSDHQKKKTRTISRWLARYWEAEKRYGVGLLGLLPRRTQKGNRNRKIPNDAYELMIKCIEREYLITVRPTISAAYALYQEEARDKTLVVSMKYFSATIKKLYSVEEITRRREGGRAAYKYEEICWYLEYTTPRHGDRPFEKAHIDHTELDIVFKDSRTLQICLGRAWLTTMLDAYSRTVLARVLSYEPPSYRSVLLVCRECVRKWGRLPQILVMDGGKEFASIYTETFQAFHEIIKMQRPPEKPKFGSVLERLFGVFNTQIIYNMRGNTQATKAVRVLTKEVDPYRNAVWTLPKFSENFDRWVDEVYHVEKHPALGMSPRECMEYGLRIGGARAHKRNPYDELFILSTLPAGRREKVKVRPGKGILVNHFLYMCPEFRDPRVVNTYVLVRYDPFDIAVAYAYVNKRWVECLSEYHQILRGYTEWERKIFTAEILKIKGKTRGEASISARRLAEFLRELKHDEAVLLAQQRAYENGQVRGPTVPMQDWGASVPEESPSAPTGIPVTAPPDVEVGKKSLPVIAEDAFARF